MSFFDSVPEYTLESLAKHIGAHLPDEEAGKLIVHGIAPVEAAGPGLLTFIENPKYLKALEETKATAVICAEKYLDKLPDTVAALVSDKPYPAFAAVMALMYPKAMRPQPVISEGISAGAFIDPTATLEDNVTVEHGAVVGANAVIGKGALIGPGAVIGPNVKIGRETSISAGGTVIHALIGDNVILHPGVRIGSDGYGFAMGPKHLKIPQVGRVIIQNDVEIGANSCVDRGSNRDTIIGEGTKIDDLVMIGHNVVIGRHCILVAQVGIAGSSELGDYVAIGGQSAVAGHVKVGAGSQLAGRSAVSSDVPPGVVWGGVPARPIKHWMREMGRLKKEAKAMDKKKGANNE